MRLSPELCARVREVHAETLAQGGDHTDALGAAVRVLMSLDPALTASDALADVRMLLDNSCPSSSSR